jgi:hypothetical protein
MGDVGIELRAAVGVLGRSPIFKSRATLIAMGRAKMIFHAAFRTMGGELATGHRDERAVAAFDDFQIADDKAIVKGDRTEGLEALARFFHEFDAYLGDLHGCSPCEVANYRQL